jgi:hypothetical protein
MVMGPADNSSDDNVHALPVPDVAAIRQHLDRLFDRCPAEYPEGRCEIAWSKQASGRTDAATFPTTPEGLDEAAACALHHNRQRSNVYVGVNPRHPRVAPLGRCKSHDVEIAFFQSTECDKPESLPRLNRPPVPFSFVVVTGHSPNDRPHCYYELADPLRDMGKWRAQQGVLRDWFDGDNVIDPPRLMRLAGTVNYPAPHKAGRGYLIEIVQLHQCKHRAPVTSDVLTLAYGTGHSDASNTAGTNGDEKGEEWPNFGEGHYDVTAAIKDIRDCPHTGGRWHDKVLRLVAHLVSRGVPAAVIMGLAEHLTLATWPLSDTVKEITGALEGAYKKRFWPSGRE